VVLTWTCDGCRIESTTVRVTEEDLAQVLEILSQDDSGVDGQWEDVIDKQSDSVAYTAKRRDPKVIHRSIFCCWCF
jgi:hypothetical protein